MAENRNILDDFKVNHEEKTIDTNVKLRVGIIGYGQRGSYVTIHSLHFINEMEVTAVCDLYQDRVDQGVKENEEKYGNKVLGTLNYHDVLNSDNVDAVYVACSWEYHIEVAIEAMKKGKIVALEVGGAYSIDELHRLVRTYEETKTPIMFMAGGGIGGIFIRSRCYRTCSKRKRALLCLSAQLYLPRQPRRYRHNFGHR